MTGSPTSVGIHQLGLLNWLQLARVGSLPLDGEATGASRQCPGTTPPTGEPTGQGRPRIVPRSGVSLGGCRTLALLQPGQCGLQSLSVRCRAPRPLPVTPPSQAWLLPVDGEVRSNNLCQERPCPEALLEGVSAFLLAVSPAGASVLAWSSPAPPPRLAIWADVPVLCRALSPTYVPLRGSVVVVGPFWEGHDHHHACIYDL